MTSKRVYEETRAARHPRDRERVLWVNVVLQAIKDATPSAGFRITEAERRSARAWFRRSNPDFLEVCANAHLDPEATYEKARRAIQRYDAAMANGETYRVEAKPRTARRGGKVAQLHTIDGVSKMLKQWAEHAGISYIALIGRMSKGRSLAEALAMPKGRHDDRGVVSNLEPLKGTGAGSTAQEIAEITFSAKANTP